MKSLIKTLLREGLNDSNIWYHGSADVRKIEKEGGFEQRTLSAEYISDITVFNKLQSDLENAFSADDKDEYHRILDMIPKLKKRLTIRKPIFLTDSKIVAKTYANAFRSMDYQNAEEKVLKVRVNTNKGVTIVSTGQNFNFIDLNNIKQGFISAGISEKVFDEVFNKFNWNVRDKVKIKTDSVAIMGEHLGFDYIDVLGVLDSYDGGSTESTVRMVFNPNDIKIIK